MNLQDYLLDSAGLRWSELLREWHWLLPPEISVWFATKAGDVFITLPDATIHMLDVGAGTLTKVAQNRGDFAFKADEPGVGEDWLMSPIVDQLVSQGVILEPGQCYSFRTLPTLGGTYGPENRMPFPIREHFGAWGSVQGQIAKLPDGTQVEIKPVDDTR